MQSLAVVFVLLLFINCSSSNLFDDVLYEADGCSTFCENEKYSNACSRGCRLYTIMNFLVYDDAEINATVNACYLSCVDAYEESGPRSNCREGCNKQQEISAAIKQKEEEELHMLTPLSHMYNMYSSLMGNVDRVMSVSWSVYVQDDDGKVIVVESPPEEEVLSPIQHRDIYSSQLKPVVIVEPESLAVEQRPDAVSNDLLDCLSLRSGLPRWFLALSIFFSAMVMIWLCFATTVTAPEQHVKQRLGVKSDLEHLKLADLPEEALPMKVKLHPEEVHDLQMAPPLPIKIRMEKV